MAHYYDTTGRPRHKVLNKVQTKEQGKDVFRNTTVADARKLNLFPSVTGILNLGEQSWVVRYKRWLWQQVIGDLSRGKIEPPATYWKRIVNEWKKRDKAPMLLGSKVHDEIERTILGCQDGNGSTDSVVCDCVASFMEWGAGNLMKVITSEQTFCSPEWGFGGTVDLQYTDKDGNDCIIDYKTKRTTAGVAIMQGLEQKRQLVAYGLGLGKIRIERDQSFSGMLALSFGEYKFTINDSPILGNLYLSTTEPGRWEWIQVPPEEIPDLILDVRDCVRLWNRANNFGPFTITKPKQGD